MPYTLSRYRVNDVSQWKRVFDERAANRKASGMRQERVWSSTADGNEIVILLEWDSLDHARQYSESADLRAAMQRAGIAGEPNVLYLEEIK